MIGLGGLELNIQLLESSKSLNQADQNRIFSSWNDWIGWIGIEYLVVGMIGLGTSELNIQQLE